MTQFLPTVVTSGSVDQQKAALKGALLGTDQSVQSCQKLTDAQRASWGAFYMGALAFATSPSSFWFAASETDEGHGYEQQLADWQKQLAAEGCVLTVPIFNPNSPTPDYTAYFKWGAIIAASVGGAYAVGKVVEVVRLFKAPAQTRSAPAIARPAYKRPTFRRLRRA